MTTPDASFDARRTGRRLLIFGGTLVFGIAIGLTIWITDKALANPDVRLERPGWLDAALAFDASFWAPLLVTVVGGAGLVLYVFWRAYRRLRAGEDLYDARLGRGLRRRGEQHLSSGSSEQL